MDTPERAGDRLAVCQVVEDYAAALDERRFERLDRVFLDGASLRYELGQTGEFTYPAAVEVFRSFLRPFWFTQHLLGQPLVELSGDLARSRTSLRAHHVQLRPDGSPNSWTVYGIYRDSLRRTADGWRIAERVFRGLHQEGEALPADAVQCFDAPPWLGGEPDAA